MSGQLSFLFTDIEGSTSWWESHANAMQVALARHDEIVRMAVADAGGFVFSTAGDAFAVVFASAKTAVKTALSIQRSLQAERWPAPLELRVRMGVHTGAAHERDGGYFGPTLNRAARVMAAANGSQVIVSAVTAGLIEDLREDGVDLVDLGYHELRGLQGNEKLFGVVDPARPTEFSLIRDSATGNTDLPAFADTFVGRTEERRQLIAAVTTHRMVTLVGPGGVGKTRLAIEAAWAALDEFPDGTRLVELAPVREEDAIAGAVAGRLEVRLQPGGNPLDAIVAGLQRRRMLIVLDNCEHVHAAAAMVCRRIVERCPTVAILGTSRSPLGVPAEKVWRLSPLVAAAEGVELFCDRAADADRDFDLDKDRLAVEALCHRLDGVPLAIELAAARVRTMTPTDLLGRLDDRFRLLRITRSAVEERHRALETTVNWSYQLLGPVERRVFDRFGVFAGSPSMEAIISVCSGGDTDGGDVADAVTDLVDQSLLVADRAASHARYRSLETMRAFARERLHEQGQLARFEARHAIYVAHQMPEMVERLRGRDELDALVELEYLWPDLRAAVAHSVGMGATDVAMRLVAGLGIEAMYRERVEVTTWVDQVLDLPGASDHPLASEALATAAILDWRAGRFDQGYERARQAYALQGAAKSANVVLAVNANYTMRGDVETPRRARSECVEYSGASIFSRVFVAELESMMYSYAGHPAVALHILDELAPDLRRVDNPLLNAQALWMRTMALLDTAPAAAILTGTKAVQAATDISAPWLVDTATNYLTAALVQAGGSEAALVHLRTVLNHIVDGAGVQSLANIARNAVVLFDRLDRPETVAVLAGWLTSHGAIPGTAGMRVHASQITETVGNALGIDRFISLSERGASMSQPEFVTYMLEQLAPSRHRPASHSSAER